MRAVVYAMGNTGLSALGLLLATVAVMTRMTPAEQGVYYTFVSLLALQVFIELGFAQALSQFVSHHALGLKEVWGVNFGVFDAQKWPGLAALYKLGYLWYRVSALLVSVGLGIGGAFFFKAAPWDSSGIFWPWIVLIASSALSSLMQFQLAFLEASNCVEEAYGARVKINIIKQFLIVAFIFGGGGLYSLGVATLISVLAGFIFTRSVRRGFWDKLSAAVIPSGGSVSWREDILPLQWRIGVSWMCGYCMFSAFSPMIFKISGAVASGRFGLTMTLLQGVVQVSSAWNNTQIPSYAQLIALNRREELRSLVKKTTLRVVYTGLLGGGGILLCLILIQSYGALASRVLSISEVAILLMGILANILIFTRVSVVRASKQEPFMRTFIIWAMITLLSAFFLIRGYGVMGACLAYSLPALLVGFPLVRLDCRRVGF